MVVENEARRGRSRASVACSRSATEESQFRHATDSDAHRGNCLLDWELGILCCARRVLHLSRALALRFLLLFTPPLPLAPFSGQVAELHLHTAHRPPYI